MRTTHTYVDLEVTPKAFDEIKTSLEDAMYHNMVDEDGITLEGVRLVRAKPMTLAQAARQASEACESFINAVDGLDESVREGVLRGGEIELRSLGN